MTSPFRVEAAGPSHVQALAALFERVDSTCHCEWWHFDGDKNAWLDRCAHRPADNQRAFSARLSGPSSHGLVALSGAGEALGWMKLTFSEAVPKLYSQRIYRGLPCFGRDRSAVLTIGCFLVDPAHRRRGVAAALLAAGIDRGRALGARAIEAFPRGGTDLRDEEIWTGPIALFLRSGFAVVSDCSAYPVLRKDLTGELSAPAAPAGPNPA